MNIITTVKKYLGPELEKIGFSIRNCDKNTIEYISEQGMILIDKGTWKKGSIHIEIFRNRNSISEETRLVLSYIANGFDDLNFTNLADWYFDTQEELIGLLEYVYEVLEKYGFTWMNHNEPVDIHEMMEEDSQRRQAVYDNSSEFEREQLLLEIKKKTKIWREQRFLPQKWKVE